MINSKRTLDQMKNITYLLATTSCALTILIFSTNDASASQKPLLGVRPEAYKKPSCWDWLFACRCSCLDDSDDELLTPGQTERRRLSTKKAQARIVNKKAPAFQFMRSKIALLQRADHKMTLEEVRGLIKRPEQETFNENKVATIYYDSVARRVEQEFQDSFKLRPVQDEHQKCSSYKQTVIARFTSELQDAG
jgi:hypothetical protein